jgi:serine protease AprX
MARQESMGTTARVRVTIFATVVLAILTTTATARDLIPQTRAYWVFFTDHGPAPKPARISPKASLRLTRRARTGVTADVAIAPSYIREISARVSRTRTTSRWLNAISVDATDAQVTAISTLPFVRCMKPVATYHRKADPSPARRPSRTEENSSENMTHHHLTQIGITKLHAHGFTGKGVLIAVLDNGFVGFDNDLRGFDTGILRNVKIVATKDFPNNTTEITNNLHGLGAFHGSGVLSVIGGYLEDRFTGAACNASFALARTEVENTETPVEEDYWIAGAEWSDSIGADIITSSIGYFVFDDPTQSHTLEDLDGSTLITQAADRAVDRGIVVVTGAGNTRGVGIEPAWEGRILFPADGFGVITVGAVNPNDQIADFSSIGPTADGRIKPDVVAPGRNIPMSGFHATCCILASGTSFATPLVAGAVALILEAHPLWTPDDVYLALTWTATDLGVYGPDNYYGYGRINADLAVDAVTDSSFLGVVTAPGSSSERVPAVGIRVEATDNTGLTMSTTTDARGYFAISPLTLGNYTVRCLSPTYATISTTASVPQTTLIQLDFGQPEAGTELYRFTPNPARLSTGVTIAGPLERGTRFTFYSVIGEKVHELPAGTLRWDLRTRTGKRLATGVYLCHAERDGKTVWKGKLAVVR